MFTRTTKFVTALLIAMTACVAAGQAPEGWFLSGSSPEDYEVGIDQEIAHGGETSAYIKSRVSIPAGFGHLSQAFEPENYKGKRVRLSAYVKTRNVENWTGLWMRVDGPDNRALSFDNMQDRIIKGTSEWKKYEIVLDVPEESISIIFGIILKGKGQAWIDDFQFEAVSKDVPTTGMMKAKEKRKKPVNLDFES